MFRLTPGRTTFQSSLATSAEGISSSTLHLVSNYTVHCDTSSSRFQSSGRSLHVESEIATCSTWLLFSTTCNSMFLFAIPYSLNFYQSGFCNMPSRYMRAVAEQLRRGRRSSEMLSVLTLGSRELSCPAFLRLRMSQSACGSVGFLNPGNLSMHRRLRSEWDASSRFDIESPAAHNMSMSRILTVKYCSKDYDQACRRQIHEACHGNVHT